MGNKRFFPGPEGNAAVIVVPMTDFRLRPVDGDIITDDAIKIIHESTGKMRATLNLHGFAQGNKFACDQTLDINRSDALHYFIDLHGGPTLGDDFRFNFKFPTTPGLLRGNPQTFEDLLEMIATRMEGGNASNVYRSLVHILGQNLGPAQLHKFSPTDSYLAQWEQQHMDDKTRERVVSHTLHGIDARIGLALPYTDPSTGTIQQFSLNRPQGSTIGPMEEFADQLRCVDSAVVSEGIGDLLRKHGIQLTQIFNPTSALHTETALQMNARRKENASHWKDISIVNDAEMDHAIKMMENREMGTDLSQIADAKFPMPFDATNPQQLDQNAVKVLRESHRRFIRLGTVEETEHTTVVMGVGCGPGGGQNMFQANGKYYIAAASTPTAAGSQRLVSSCGGTDGTNFDSNVHDVVGAGDAAFTATLIHQYYSPLEDIIEKRVPNLSSERLKIAAMAFTTILQRVFGELVFHSKVRDLSAVPAEVFPALFDKVLDKAIAAADTLVTIDKVPNTVYTDPEWGISFMAMELERMVN